MKKCLILLILSGCGGEDRTVVFDRVHDLVALIDKAELTEGSPYFNRPMAGIQSIDNRDGLAYLRATPGAPIVFRNLYTRGKAVLELGCGVAQLTKMMHPSSKVRFQVEAGKGESLEVIFDVTLSPSDLPSETRYLSFERELASGGEAEWTLRFSCEAVDSAAKPEWCGWISPRLVSDGRTVDHPVPRLTSGEAPTVLLVVVETLRADFLGAYGSDRGLTPRLDAMAKKSVLFSNVRSVSSWTWPSVTSILTGLYPNSHGIKDMEYCFLVDRIETIAELFAKKGYTTGAFLSNLLISRDNNFHQGFETFVLTPNVTARALNERVKNWLDNTQGLARFAYIHYYDPHSPYKPPKAFSPARDPGESALYDRKNREKLFRMNQAGQLNQVVVQRLLDDYRRYYGAEIAYFDRSFGELMEAVEERGLLENCIVVFTSDHGEEFLEHGAMDHGPNLFDETLKVPLWISGYGKAAMDPRVVPHQVETKDIYFTLCELASIPLPRSFGNSLLQGGPDLLFSQTLIGREPTIRGDTEKLSVIQGQWKLIHAPESNRTLLYDLEKDPGERNDRSAEHADRRDAMLEILKAWEKSTQALAPDSRIGNLEEMEKRLKALGYTGN